MTREEARRIASLHRRMRAAPLGSRARRHLRRAYLRAIARAQP